MIEIFCDIETVETQSDRLRKHVIAKLPDFDDLDELDEAERVAVDKTALNAAFGEVASVCFAVNMRTPVTFFRSLDEHERPLIVKARDHLGAILAHAEKSREKPRLIGHNLVGFDRPFLCQRGLVHGVAMPWILTREVKPWESMANNREDFVADTMFMWSQSHRGFISQDDLCAALGLEGKGRVSGADVGRMMREGRHAEVAAYNADDVVKMRAAYYHMKKAREGDFIPSVTMPVTQTHKVTDE